MRILVSHVTRMDFAEEVTESVLDARLGPRDDDDQRVQRFQVKVEPAGHVRRYDDGFGNVAHLLTSMRPHAYLQVSAETEVHTHLIDPFQQPTQPPAPLAALELFDALAASPLPTSPPAY